MPTSDIGGEERERQWKDWEKKEKARQEKEAKAYHKQDAHFRESVADMERKSSKGDSRSSRGSPDPAKVKSSGYGPDPTEAHKTRMLKRSPSMDAIPGDPKPGDPKPLPHHLLRITTGGPRPGEADPTPGESNPTAGESDASPTDPGTKARRRWRKATMLLGAVQKVANSPKSKRDIPLVGSSFGKPLVSATGKITARL
jgi:hypothetical protein